MKLSRYYYVGTIIVCILGLLDSFRVLFQHHQKIDLANAVVDSIISLWIIVALLVLIESIRKERKVPAALFYVVTMATFFITAPEFPNFTLLTLILQIVFMSANIIVHAWLLYKLRSSKPIPSEATKD